FDNGRSLLLELFEDAGQFLTMWSDEPIENRRGDPTEVLTQILIVEAVRNSNAGRHMNQQFVNDKPLHTKRHEFLGRETAEVTQFVCFCCRGCDVLSAKYCRER